MHQKPCRLTLADKFSMGGGGAPEPPPPRNLGEELSDIYGVFKRQGLRSYRQFVRKEPLLAKAQPVALRQLANVPALQAPLTEVYKKIPDVSRLTGPLQTLIGQQMGTYTGQINPILATGGALTPGQRTTAEQQALSLAARSGMATGPQGIAGAVLGSEAARQQRFAQALGQATQLSGSIGGLTGQVAGLRGMDISNRLGLAQGIQGLSTDALKAVYGGELAQTGAYQGMIGPLLSYGADVANTNYNAQAAANIMAANQAGAKGGGTMQLIGSVVGAAGAAY
jgi:hypothetical protein